MRIEQATPWSQIKLSTTWPLHSSKIMVQEDEKKYIVAENITTFSGILVSALFPLGQN